MFETEKILCVCVVSKRLQFTRIIVQQILIDLNFSVNVKLRMNIMKLISSTCFHSDERCVCLVKSFSKCFATFLIWCRRKKSILWFFCLNQFCQNLRSEQSFNEYIDSLTNNKYVLIQIDYYVWRSEWFNDFVCV